MPPGYVVGPIPLDQPYYNAGPKEAVVRFFKKYLTFSGRAGRAEFWWWYLASAVLSVVFALVGLGIGLSRGVGLTQLSSNSNSVGTVLAWVFQLATLVGWTALAVRRLHDTNRTGWWVLLYIPTFVVGVWQVLAPITTTTFAGSAPDPAQLNALLVRFGVILACGACAVPLLVFYLSAPKPEGRRFDRQA